MKQHTSVFLLFTFIQTVIGSITICPSLPPCTCHRKDSRSVVICTSVNNTATLSSVIPQTHSDLPSVTIVNSSIPTLNSNAFGSLRVGQLLINADNVTNITTDAFKGLEEIRRLDIADNLLDEVPANSLHRLVNLVTLNLAGNQIRSISKNDFNSLISLRYLSLAKNVIKDIEVGSFPVWLKQLGLSGNQLETLNGAVSGLRSLEWLLLSNNSLRTLNAREFEAMESVKILWLNDNVLEEMAGAFEGLPQLKMLGLSRNRIRSIDGVFNYIPSLKEVRLSGNQIRRLAHLGNLPGLNEIDLSQNGMEFIALDAFEKTPRVTKLNLKNNRLKTFPVTALAPLNRLVTLDLSRNMLESVDVSQLNLPTLKHLFLSGNKLTTLPDNLFQSFPSLQDLDVTYNLLTSLDLAPEASLRKLYLRGNPFRCDLTTIKALDKLEKRLDKRPFCTNAILPISQEKID